jgi:hypothetical protein
MAGMVRARDDDVRLGVRGREHITRRHHPGPARLRTGSGRARSIYYVFLAPVVVTVTRVSPLIPILLPIDSDTAGDLSAPAPAAPGPVRGLSS